jgi:putative ABC transport system permease protein
MAGSYGLPRALLFTLLAAALRTQPLRLVLAVLCIALGVALGLSIAIINRSALDSFSQALSTVHGQADASIVARNGDLRDDDYLRVLQLPAIADASPLLILEGVDVRLATGGASGRVRVIGLDPLRAAQVAPALVPSLAPLGGSSTEQEGGSASPLFADDAVFLSAKARLMLGAQTGDTIELSLGGVSSSWRVVGDLPGADPDAMLLVVDIANAQWRFAALGRLSQIDVRLREGADRAMLSQQLEPPLMVQRVQAQAQRMANLSRAYRVNLNMLALVALLTGGFIVAASLSLVVRQQAGALALLQVLGSERRWLQTYVLMLGVWLGLAGGLLGIGTGMGLAKLLLLTRDGSLGSAFFDWKVQSLSIDPWGLLLFLGFGIGSGLLGAWGPAQQAWTPEPARRLRAQGPEQRSDSRTRPLLIAAALLAITALGLLQGPALAGLPVAAYGAIVLILSAGLLVVPAMLRGAVLLVNRWAAHWLPGAPVAWLAARSLSWRPSLQAGALNAIVASFALSCAMAVMVSSFRGSVERWLEQVLPADLYLRAPPGVEGFSRANLQRMQGWPEVASLEGFKATELHLSEDQPKLALLARPLPGEGSHAEIGQVLPLTGPTYPAPSGFRGPIVYVSEAVPVLYGVSPGTRWRLPLGRQSVEVWVGAVWRDYARPSGAVVIDLSVFQAFTGQSQVGDVALRLIKGDGTDPAKAVLERLQREPELQLASVQQASAIRALSLQIFDRSFVVTRLLEWAALFVGMFGLASVLTAETLARRKEYGLMLHLGLSGPNLQVQWVVETIVQVGCAALWGLMVGLALAWVLVHRVNPQSFHWTMDLAIPWASLAGNYLALIVVAAGLTWWVARRLAKLGAARAVREES